MLDMGSTAFIADTHADVHDTCVHNVFVSYLTTAIGVKSGMLQTIIDCSRLCTTHVVEVCWQNTGTIMRA